MERCFGLLGLHGFEFDGEIRYKEESTESEFTPTNLTDVQTHSCPTTVFGTSFKLCSNFLFQMFELCGLCHVGAHFCINAISCGALHTDRKANKTQ